MTIIWFCTQAPDPIAEELNRMGFPTFECLSLSEVFNLAEQHPNGQIVITHGVDSERVNVIRKRFPTLVLTPDATEKDVLWELSNQFRTRSLQ